jgi:hypothetical protein
VGQCALIEVVALECIFISFHNGQVLVARRNSPHVAILPIICIERCRIFTGLGTHLGTNATVTREPLLKGRRLEYEFEGAAVAIASIFDRLGRLGHGGRGQEATVDDVA